MFIAREKEQVSLVAPATRLCRLADEKKPLGFVSCKEKA